MPTTEQAPLLQGRNRAGTVDRRTIGAGEDLAGDVSRVENELDDKLWAIFSSPFWRLTNAVLGTAAASYSGWTIYLQEQPKFKADYYLSLGRFVFDPFAEVSLRKRYFQATKTTGVWWSLREARRAKDGWCSQIFTTNWLYVALCFLLPIDNIVGCAIRICYLLRLSSPSHNAGSRADPEREPLQESRSKAAYTLLFDFCTIVKRAAYLGQLLFLGHRSEVWLIGWLFGWLFDRLHYSDGQLDGGIVAMAWISATAGHCAAYFAEMQHGETWLRAFEGS